MPECYAGLESCVDFSGIVSYVRVLRREHLKGTVYFARNRRSPCVAVVIGAGRKWLRVQQKQGTGKREVANAKLIRWLRLTAQVRFLIRF